jgi:hypothetical protein
MDGIRMLFLENEMLRVTILPDNGCDIADINYKPNDISFLLRTRQGLQSLKEGHNNFSDRFNETYHGGWFEAFPNVGLSCQYKGISFAPYDEVKYLAWDSQVIKDEPDEVTVKFSVKTLKTPFYLEKIIRISSGVPAIFIEETITNHAQEPFAFQWGHHPLLGRPFLSGDCVIDFEGAAIDTFFEFENARVKQGTKGKWPEMSGKKGNLDLRTMPQPFSGTNDLYWLSNLKGNWIAVRNNKNGVGFGLAWDNRIFDHCLLWMNANGDEGYPHYGDLYTLCIMPSNTGINTLEAESKTGKLRTLKPGETISTWITASAFKHHGNLVQSISKNGNVQLNHA